MTPRYEQNHRYQQDANKPIELLLKQPYYGMVETGKKTIEGRVAYSFLNRAQAGSQLDFKRNPHATQAIHCDIDWVLRASNFEEALIEVEWQKAVPNVNTFDDALAVYERIYTPAKIQQIGGVILMGFTKQGNIQ